MQVRFVPLRTDMKLLVTPSNSPRPVDEYPPLVEDKTLDGAKLDSREAVVEVPRDRPMRLWLENLVDPRAGLKINLWEAKPPSMFVIQDVERTSGAIVLDAGKEKRQGALITYRERSNGSGEATEDDWQLITTDATHQVFHIKLRLRTE